MHRIVQFGFLLVVFVFTVSACSQSDLVVAPLHETDKDVVESGVLGADGSGLVTKPFRGQYATTFTLPTTPPPFLEFYIWGEGVATLLGSSSWEGPSVVDLTQIPPVQTSTALFTAADGSQILMTAVGVSVPGPDEIYEVGFEGTFTLSDGTERFAGATGYGTYAGIASSQLGVGEIAYDGTITMPKPPTYTPGGN